MEQEKGHSTKIQVTGCEAQASTSEVIAQQSFESWVSAMESDWLEQQRELARIAIGQARAARRAKAEQDENDWLERAVRSEMDLIESEREQRRMLWVEAGAEV